MLKPEEKFCAWLETAKPGDRYIYHKGCGLMIEVGRKIWAKRPVALVAMEACETGQCYLVQKKSELVIAYAKGCPVHEFEYIAEKI